MFDLIVFVPDHCLSFYFFVKYLKGQSCSFFFFLFSTLYDLQVLGVMIPEYIVFHGVVVKAKVSFPKQNKKKLSLFSELYGR